MKQKLFAVLTLGWFICLVSFAYGRAEQWKPHKYLASYSTAVKLWKPTKAEALARKQAEVLVAVYGLTPENENAYKEWW